MKKIILLLFCTLLCGYAFAQVESNRQVQWGFIAFISRIVLVIFAVGSLVFGFLFLQQLKFSIFSKKRSGRRRSKRKHSTSGQNKPALTKRKTVYQVFLIICLSATIITYYIYLKAVQAYETPEPEPPIEVPVVQP